MSHIRTRFAPSPTGHLHIGGVRTALYNWLLSRKNKGKFILRIEDTDLERSTEESVRAILDGMKWLGLLWDEGPEIGGPFGPYKQSERLMIYQSFIDQLLKENKAYKCYCSQDEINKKKVKAKKAKIPYQYDRTCRHLTPPELEKRKKDSFTIRLKMDWDEEIIFNDLVRGEVKFHTSQFDDFIIVKSDGYPVYNFAVVIDDVTMKIDHVIRGDDHISNTPRQILIYKALGLSLPEFAHLPMILGEDKSRLSKRHGATSVQQFREMGYLPDALINYLARLGWSYDDSQEIFSREELVHKFSLEKVSKNSAVFNFDKLNWLNNYYIQHLPLQEKVRLCLPFLIKSKLLTEKQADQNQDVLEKIIDLLGPRIILLSDIIHLGDFFFKNRVEFTKEALDRIILKFNCSSLYAQILQSLPSIISWTKEEIIKTFEELSNRMDIKKKDFFQTIRVALTGSLTSPDLIGIMLILGKEKTISRFQQAINAIDKNNLRPKNPTG
ncbi:MAG: glutamate--tRNA ligase [Spirochaetes bacterium]|nr:glutamate--tRNA ligase [Spirochaetota bacterium]